MSINRESSLTTPEDRNPEIKFSLNSTASPLAESDAVEAMNSLNITSYTRRFPEVERRYADPAIDLQKIGLISFVPAKGATPNEKGVYGFAKLRGNFGTETEANERAEYIIRNIDSYHEIYHCYVGRPFPITSNNTEYCKEVSRVDLQKQMTTSISEDVKKKREKEQREIEEIKNKEKELLEDVKTEEKKEDRYTTLRVKKAQLTWTYLETKKKLSQMTGLIAKCRKEIEDMDKTDLNLQKIYYDKYIEARRQAGLTEDKARDADNFIKYMGEDVAIPEVEEEYKRLFQIEENAD